MKILTWAPGDVRLREDGWDVPSCWMGECRTPETTRVDVLGKPGAPASGDLKHFPIAKPAKPEPGGAPKRVLGMLHQVLRLQRVGILSAVQGNVNAFSSSDYGQCRILGKRMTGRTLPRNAPRGGAPLAPRKSLSPTPLQVRTGLASFGFDVSRTRITSTAVTTN